MKVNSIPAATGVYSESAQSVELRTCLLNKEADGSLTPMFAPVKCRDYYNDILHSQYAQKTGTVYGFTASHTKQKLDQDALRLLIVCNSGSVMKNVQAHLEGMLHPIEEQNSFKKTVMTVVMDKHIVLEADPVWQSSSFLMGIYTLFIRLSGYDGKIAKNWKEIVTSLPPKTPKDAEDHIYISEKMFFHQPKKLMDFLPKLGIFANMQKERSVPPVANKDWEVHTTHNYGVIAWLGNWPAGTPQCKLVNDVLAA